VVGEVDLIKEKGAHCSEHPSLVRDLGIKDVVIGTDPVADNHQQVVVIDLVDLSHFTCGMVLVLAQFWTHE